ncbi:MAG: hypothetical protein LBV36_07685 [Chromatiales bacterium]|jgi:hypothetical protein|nr:hypothetical protein [Chromatiales bacterium]
MIRKYFLAALVVLIPVTGFAQLQELETSTPEWKTLGETAWGSTTKARLQAIEGGGTTYRLYLKDETTLKNSRNLPVFQYFSIVLRGFTAATQSA